MGTLGDVKKLGAEAPIHDLCCPSSHMWRTFGDFLTRPVMASTVLRQPPTQGRKEEHEKLGASFESAH